MLILTRKPGESLYIGDSIKVQVLEIKGHQIRIGIDAPQSMRIYREEIYLQIQDENRKAAEALASSSSNVEQDLNSLAQMFAGEGGAAGGDDDENGSVKKRPSVAPLAGGTLRLGSMKRTSVNEQGERPAFKQPQVVVRRKKGKNSDE